MSVQHTQDKSIDGIRDDCKRRTSQSISEQSTTTEPIASSAQRRSVQDQSSTTKPRTVQCIEIEFNPFQYTTGSEQCRAAERMSGDMSAPLIVTLDLTDWQDRAHRANIEASSLEELTDHMVETGTLIPEMSKQAYVLQKEGAEFNIYPDDKTIFGHGTYSLFHRKINGMKRGRKMHMFESTMPSYAVALEDDERPALVPALTASDNVNGGPWIYTTSPDAADTKRKQIFDQGLGTIRNCAYILAEHLSPVELDALEEEVISEVRRIFGEARGIISVRNVEMAEA